MFKTEIPFQIFSLLFADFSGTKNGCIVFTGVVVGKVIAEDRDEPYTLHTTLKYRIVSQTPPITPAFSLHGDTGVISVLLPQLDREVIFPEAFSAVI